MQLNKVLTVIALSLLMAFSVLAQGSPGGRSQDAPSWARGTWYWMNGPDRRMTIDNNGRISLNTAGQTTYGVYYDGKIYLDGNASTITRIGNNIRTYNENTGESSDYSRNQWRGGNNNGGNNNGGYGNNNGDNSENAPDWARGTWYWMNGPDRTMTIDNNGSISLNTAGQTTYGRYWRGKIFLDGNTSTVTKVGNNIRTYNENTGESSDYSRNQWKGGNNNGGNNNGGYNNGGVRRESPPDWARGTWYWKNGPDRKMTISSDGRISLNTAGETTYGNYWRGKIYLDGNTSTVTKIGNNIRTYNQDTGETSDYTRSIWRQRN
jgi:hypothetical protein